MEIAAIGDELLEFHRLYAAVFQRREQRHCSAFYLCGQLSDLERKTIEPMVLALHGSDLNAIRALQQFIGQSPWSASQAIKQHQRLVSAALAEPCGVVIVDGCGFPKQGLHSAGVAHQYCGHLGKLANCQEGVFAVYATSQGCTFLDARLYVPEHWFGKEHAARRKRCGIPADVQFQTEPAIALQMVRELHHEAVVPFRWVACDERYGQNHAFLDGIASLGKYYFAEVPHNTVVWRRAPTVRPPGRGPLGRPRRQPRVAPHAPRPRALRTLADNLPRAAWRRYWIKEGSKGPLAAEFAFVRVTTVRDELPGPRLWAVLRRSLHNPLELKCYLTNAPHNCARRDLAQLAGWRWPVESSFEEAQGEAGLDHYETRSWRGWHHHMTQSLMAHFFLVRLCLRLKKSPSADHRTGTALGKLCAPGRQPTRTRHHRDHRIPSTAELRRILLPSDAHPSATALTH
jgi:SRSO17 transposase